MSIDGEQMLMSEMLHSFARPTGDVEARTGL